MGAYEIPAILSSAGFHVEKFIDHFPKSTPDMEWLQEVGRRGWIVLSKDKMIRKRKLEREALRNAKVGAFILTSGSMTAKETAEAFINAHKGMLRFLEANPRPFIATVSRDGKVRKAFGK